LVQSNLSDIITPVSRARAGNAQLLTKGVYTHGKQMMSTWMDMGKIKWSATTLQHFISEAEHPRHGTSAGPF
jgi:hypothetical protein